MSGLVGYGSSDDEEDSVGNEAGVNQILSKGSAESNSPRSKSKAKSPERITQPHERKISQPIVAAPISVPTHLEEPLVGPSLGPSFPTTNEHQSGLPLREQSPNTAYREAVQNLTLPTVPSFDIPPSPPGSPSPGIGAKIRQFTKLKKQGMHFNQKLASSSALKNPSLLGKLIANAGLTDDQQYANSLPTELWDPSKLEDWMFKESLEQARQAAEKSKHDAAIGTPRNSVDFVPAKTR